jgi:hypothetical protein
MLGFAAMRREGVAIPVPMARKMRAPWRGEEARRAAVREEATKGAVQGVAMRGIRTPVMKGWRGA